MSTKKEPKWIIDFVDAVYEGNGEVAMAMFTEEEIMKTAIKKINAWNMLKAKGAEEEEEFYDRSITPEGDAFMVTRLGKCNYLWVLIDSVTSNLPLRKWAREKTEEHFAKVQE